MRLILLLPCVFIAGAIGMTVFAQSDGELFPGSEETFRLEDDVTTGSVQPASAVPESVEEVANEQEKLRQQYLELIEKKSAHMDRSALREAISRAERDIDELKADAKLQEAKQLLLDLVKTHPETSASQTARTMLQADPQSRSGLPSTMYRGSEILPQPFDPGAEHFPSNGDFERPSTNFEQPAAPAYDPFVPVKSTVPVKPRPRKKGQVDEPFESPFDNEAKDEPLNG